MELLIPFIPLVTKILSGIMIFCFVISSIIGDPLNCRKWFNVGFMILAMVTTYVYIAGLYLLSFPWWGSLIYIWLARSSYVATTMQWEKLK